MKITVTNERKISEYLKIKIEFNQDLMKSNDIKIKEFLEKYMNVFTSTKYEDFNKFYEETGLFFTRVYKPKDRPYIASSDIFINELGMFTKHEYDDKTPSFRHHLLVVIEVDEIIKENEEVYIINDNKKECVFKENLEYEILKEKKSNAGYKIRNFQNTSSNINDLITLIKELLGDDILSFINEKDIKQIQCVYPYNDLLILLNDGTLYLNDKVYSTNVKAINSLNSFISYIIYQDLKMEYYTHSHYLFALLYNFDKIVWGNQLLVILNNGCLTVESTIKDWPDEVIFLTFNDVDDIEYEEENDCLIIKKNQEQIELNLFIFTHK